MKKYVYVHISCINNWHELVMEIFDKIASSGLLDVVDKIRLCILGNNNQLQQLQSAIQGRPKMEIRAYGVDLTAYERFTLRCLYDDSQKEDFYALYLHTKGVTRYGEECYGKIIDWVKYLHYFTITRHSDCFKSLDEMKADTIGCNTLLEPKLHYSGNMWWARSTYVKSLPREIGDDYLDPEMWLLSGQGKFITAYESCIIHYHEFYPSSNYVNRPLMNKVVGEPEQVISPKYTASLCAIYKNEGTYLAEWIEFHRIIGVEHFYLYNNMSTDNHHEILQKYIAEGIVTYTDYNVDFTVVSFEDAVSKITEVGRMCVRDYGHETKWLGWIDIDEFVVLRDCETIQEFLRDYDEHSGVCINMMWFGNTHTYLEPTRLVTENYFLRASKTCHDNHYMKTFVKPSQLINWPDVHLPEVHGNIVYEEGTVAQPIRNGLPHSFHKRASIYHYSGKSKWYYIFKKAMRFFTLNDLKTPIVNTHCDPDGKYSRAFYGNILRWESQNTFEFNCIEDITMMKWIPELKRRLNIQTSTAFTFLDNLLIDRTDYIARSPDVKKYLDENLIIFGGSQEMAALFHYWFIFDEYDIKKVKLVPARSYIAQVDIQKYRTPIFLDTLKQYVLDPDEAVITDNVIYSFIIQYECMLPPGFSLSSYSIETGMSFPTEIDAIRHYINIRKCRQTLYENTRDFDWLSYIFYNRDLASIMCSEDPLREHWYKYGQHEGRKYTPKIEFDWRNYLDKYADLRDAGICDQNGALSHYVTHGINEGRTDK